VGGEPLRDTALLGWCAELLRDVLGEPARPAREVPAPA
jgi:transcription-repair coupling factor (superfamily II helicase)